jgi:uncharacterized protein (TIGR03435 family)
MHAMVLIPVGLLLFQQPAFEVVSVKPKAARTRVINTMLTFPGGRITCTGCWLQYLIMEAFDVQPHQIVGGPGWLNDDQFDLEARPPAGSRASHANPPLAKLPMNDEQRQMLQTLLVDRFQLKYHRDDREGTVYFLVKTNKKLKLDPAKDKDAYPWAGAPQGTAFDSGGIAGTNITMTQLAARLSNALGRPVIDRTGLDGPYDFKYEYAGDVTNPDRATAILMSIQQLGLKLESGKGPVKTIVIDHAEKPSEN